MYTLLTAPYVTQMVPAVERSLQDTHGPYSGLITVVGATTIALK